MDHEDSPDPLLAPAVERRLDRGIDAALSTPAGMSSTAHAVVGHGTPAGCEGNGPRLGVGVGVGEIGPAAGLQATSRAVPRSEASLGGLMFMSCSLGRRTRVGPAAARVLYRSELTTAGR